MNEDGNAAPAPEGGEALETTNEAEVLEVLGKTSAETEEITEEEPEQPETPEAPETEETEEPEKPEAPAKAEEAKPAEPEAPTETPTFTVEIEDANGKKFTVGPEDNLEEVLAEFEPKNNGQVLQLMRDLDRLGNEQKAWTEQQEEQKTEAEKAARISEIQASWDKEVLKLQGEKRLPLDGKIEDRKSEVFKFIAEENAKRTQEGRPLLQSFEDALDKLELQERQAADKKAEQDKRVETRRRGGMVGGSSAPASSGGPVYRAGAARNASEAINSLGLLDR